VDKTPIDFKDAGLLKNFLTERGRIVPRRISGNCLRHQRELTVAIKRARHIAIISFAEERP
jgi:small subunit ribosomal protein S18